jgi:hypothetical protein
MGRTRNNLAALMLGISAVFASAPVAAGEAPKTAPAACTNVVFDDESAGAPTKGVRIDLAGACARLTGEVDYEYQNNLSTRITGAPSAISSRALSSVHPWINTGIGIVNLDTKRATPIGDLVTNTEVQWLKASNDGTDGGTVTVQSLYGSLAGATVGYTSSLMDFWNGDFLFLATTPELSVGIAAYEFQLVKNTMLAFAAESGLPSSAQTSEGIRSLDFSSPTATARLRYVGDDGVTLHLSGLVRQAEFEASAWPFHPQAASTKPGWAPSFGATVPSRLTGENDTVSMQATYAVNALQSLGTRADISRLESIVPDGGPTKGWSVVASLNHPWSAKWESNAFVSFISIDADLLYASPAVRTTQVDANVYWHPCDALRLGAEIGWLRSDIDAHGAEGYLSGVSADAVVGYISAKSTF